MNANRKDFNRFLILIFITLIIALWFMVNSSEFYLTAVVYIVFAIILIIVYQRGTIIPQKSKPLGIDRTIKKDVFIGIIGGIGFILLNFMVSFFAIGIPTIPFSMNVIGRWVFSVVVAPVLEEGFFRGMIPQLLKKGLSLPILPAVLIMASCFSFFHWAVYGLGLTAAFVGAFIFAVVTYFISQKTKSLLPAIIMHSIFNTWLLLMTYVKIGVPT